MSTGNISVSELNDLVKATLTDGFPDVITVVGEISNKKLSNGNVYMTLKDADAAIDSIIWKKSFALICKDGTTIENGDEVSCTGKLDMYTKTGRISLVISKIKKNNKLGQLYDDYEKLKISCNQLGYFDTSRKKLTPVIIRNVGIITAATGAALQDILYVFKNNDVKFNVYVKNCAVQGKNCADDIVKSVEYFETVDLDVLLLARGGGSMEDLFGFSDIAVIKSIVSSRHYTISAVGHEVDFMLSDFAADHRAPTPSIAAETISKIYANMITQLHDSMDDTRNMIDNKIAYYKNHIATLKNMNANKLNNIISTCRQQYQSMCAKIDNKLMKMINRNNEIRHILQSATQRNQQLHLSSKSIADIKTSADFMKQLNRRKCQEFTISFPDGDITILIKLK
ncbi:MAG: exodeoxyribonuclease VII large subunit [Faunusvirus sp.]|jgi:exodeoxyribonuclease VII large subunit|uniref:Exodeoxyribonuclease VII large subunit n=1 Tax=Faunusvirus sp. TaxID=2487766 RepID=A0A3G4ZZY4_9VIRU|nr:MAG: exodeoxyribonuclease VII large subunit [Faunusvirus sp.]